jgi:DNA-binding NarL/FixJ family response regulator
VIEPTRAVVIEGLPLVRAGISSVLREQHVAVIAEASSATDASVLVRGADAHLVVVGDSGDGVGLADAVQRVKDRNAEVCVVALVPRCSRDELLAILDAGADAIVPHDVGRDELVEAVEAARGGRQHLSPALTSILFASVRPEDLTARDAHSLLTTRELSVVRLLAGGRTNEEIGSELFISSATVKTHLSNAYEKLGARNRYDAVVKATQRGLL